MRRDVSYFFAVDVKDLYNAYLAAATNDRFRREPNQEPYHTLSFGLNFSMKYNFNGGACTLRFIPCQGGSAVNMRFTLAQGVGARCEKYAKDLTDAVTLLLGVPAQRSSIDVEIFLNDDNKVARQTVKEEPQPTPPTPVVEAPPVSNFSCTNCGNGLKEGDRFCSACGSPVEVQKRFCTQCGKEVAPTDAFCSSCGNKLG